MRMKKLMIFAVAAIALVACSKEFDTNKSASNGTAIGFGTWTEQLTKARTPGQSGTTFTNGDHFWVYGYKTINAENKGVFRSQEVTTGDGSTWTYTPKKFWDSGATSYTFFAISRIESSDPTADGNKTTSVTNGNFGSSDISFSGNDQDILVAKTITRAKTAGSGNFNTFAAVPLDFHHIASIVDLKVRKAPNLTGSTVAITGVSLINIKDQGTFSVAYSDGDDTYSDGTTAAADLPIATWTPAGHTTAYDNTKGVGGTVTLPSDVTLYASATTGDNLITNLIVMPQALAADAQQLQISYTITTNVGGSDPAEVITVTDATVDLNKFDSTNYISDNQDEATQNAAPFITYWTQGKHYTYYVTIDVHTIEFTASITDWADATGYHYLLN